MITTDTLHVTCQEKGRGDKFEADVAPDCTANEIVRGLVEAGYLAAPTGTSEYKVTNGRTNTEISANTSLASADVEDGEVLMITTSHHGA